MRIPRLYASTGGAALLLTAALTASLTGGPATADQDGNDHRQRSEVKAHLDPLNNSGVTGEAEVKVKNHRHLDIEVEAAGLLAGAPHAQHIHFGEQARHECPTVADDSNGDFRLTTAEGLPGYGPIQVSLTTRGDTSPGSGLAVTRFPTADNGRIDYDRDTRTSPEVARAIARGEAVVVIHGVDYNNNGTYDFDSAGASELDSTLPAEATDPAACGVLQMD